MATPYTGMDEEYGLAEQSTWGTAVTDGANFNSDTSGSFAREVAVDAADIVPGVNLRRPNRARGIRYPYLPDYQADAKGIEHTFAFRGPFFKQYGAFLLYGLFQNVTESTTSSNAWTKTYTPHSTQPDFTASAGAFFTFNKKMPVASTSKQLYDAIFRSISLHCGPGEGEEATLMFDGELVGRNYSETKNLTGTYTPPATQTYYSFYDITTKTLGGTDMIIGDGGITWNFANNSRPIGGSGATFESYILTFTGTIEVNILWDAGARTQMANYRNGTDLEIILEWGSANTDGHLKFTAQAVWDSAALDSAEEGTFVNLTGTLGQDSSGNAPITLLMADDTDRGF